jgi:hypothetical protein
MLSDFVKWIVNGGKNRILDEGIWGMWDYKVPTDKKEQMYDFYMMEYLLPPGVQLYLTPIDFGGYDPDEEARLEDEERKKQGLPSDQRAAGDMKRTLEDKFNYALYEVVDKLVPYLRNELLQVVEFSVAAELRHLWDKNESQYDPKALIRRVERVFGPKEAEMLKKYALHIAGQKHSVGKAILNMDREDLHPNLNSSNADYKGSYRGMKASGGTTEEWMKLAAWLFENTKWSSQFGGGAWAQIAEGWLALKKAKYLGHVIAQIDHVYDLQHNTDTVFNKIETYAKHGGYDWVKTALDHKRYLVSPYEMIEHVSPAMRELALIGIKLRTGKSWGEFEKEWPEILKKKTDIYNQTKHSLWQSNKEAYYKQYYSYDEPMAITPEQFTTHHIKASTHPWSVYNFGKNLQQVNTYNATDKVPLFKDIQVGDQVSLAWPAKAWYDVMAKHPSSGEQSVTFGTKPDALTLSNMGMTPYNMIKGYRPKAKAQYPPQSTPLAPAEPTASPYLDSSGQKLDIGDTVKKLHTISGKHGKVIKLLPGNVVEVQWPEKNKSYFAHALVLISKAQMKPATAGEWPITSKPWHGIGAVEPSMPEEKPEPPKVVLPPSAKLPPAPKPSWTPPTPEEKAASNKAAANKIINELPNVAKPIKYARVIKGLGISLSLDAMIDVLQKALEIKLTSEEKDAVKKAYAKEKETELYFRNKGHHKFPKSINSDQAFASIQQKFPNAPYVAIDLETRNAIDDLLMKDDNAGALALARKATQFDTSAATGYIVLKRLELYMEGKIKD